MYIRGNAMADKVLSFTDRVKKTEDTPRDETPADLVADMERNKAKEEKRAKVRLDRNKSVLRAYRIKN